MGRMPSTTRSIAPAGPFSGHRRMDSTFKPTFFLVCGRAIGFAASFGIPIVLVRIFTPTEFGTYKQLFLIYATLYGIGQLGMAESLFYFLPLAPRRGGRYILNAILALAAAGLACLVVLVVGGPHISSLLGNSDLSADLPLIGTYLLLVLPAAVLEIAMISRKRYLSASSAYAVSDLLRAVSYLLPVLFSRHLHWLLIGGVAYAALRLCATLAYVGHEFHQELRPDASLLRGQLAYALPFEMAVVAETLQANFHQYAVSYYFDAATFAIYTVGCLQLPLVDFLGTSAANVMMVRMTEEIRDGRGKAVLGLWHDTTRRLAVMCFPLVGLVLVNARPIIVLLFTDAYRASVPIFMISSTAILLCAIQTDAVMRVYAQTRFLFVLNAIRLLLIAALMPRFLSALHLPGAVLVTLLAAVVAKGLALERMKHLMGIGRSQALPWRSLAAIAAIAAAAALPALLLKSAVAMPAPVLLLTTSLVYAGSYGVVLYGTGLSGSGEKLPKGGWQHGWVAGVAQAGRIPQSVRRAQPAEARER